ncbi:MAG TPA: ATP-binding protein [Solirubrobacterales bacterium]|nr:ATP-binding protein [Solirubrobacterales bacterium]
MALELVEIATGLPMAASFALAGGITTLREGRRRSVLNEAMHELRRPLHALSLALPADSATADSSLRLAVAALERLDREINGSPPEAGRETVAVHRLLHATAERWKTQGVLQGRRLQLGGNAAEKFVHGDPVGLAQALDNLINNAFEHGGGEVTVEAREDRGGVCLAVRDGGRFRAPARLSRQGRKGERGRRGHGLRVVQRVAREHGGSFDFRRSRQGSEARIWLPIAAEVRG